MNDKSLRKKYIIFFKDIFGIKKLIFISICCLITIFLDSFSVALVIPLMKIVQTSDYNFLGINISSFLNQYDLKSLDFVLISFLIYIFIKNIILFIINYYKSVLVFQIQSTLSKKILSNYIKKEFNDFRKIQFAEINRNTISEVGHLVSLFSLSIDIFAETLIVLTIILIIGYANYSLLLFSFAYLAFGFLLYRFTKTFLFELGKQRIDNEKNRITIIQNIYNNIKEIKIYNAQHFFLKKYSSPNLNVSYTHAMEQTISPINKYVFEILTVISVFIYMKFISNTSDIIADAILIFVAMFRIFPSFNKILSGLQKVNVHKKSFNNIYNLYYEKIIISLNTSKSFDSKIKIFQFSLNKVEIDHNKFIENLNISFNSNDKLILIRAKSGFGKSVLLNCMSGLLDSDCTFLINKKYYNINEVRLMEIFSYNSQNAPLLNDTIIQNIIFNDDEDNINENNLKNAIHISGLKNVINSYAQELKTIVSDRGHNFSGGQSQRITLARTIYKNKKIMILDESLSALDQESQIQILDNIRKYYKGIVIVVSHDPLKYEGFNKVIDIDRIN